MEEMSLKEALHILEMLSISTEGAIKTQEPLFGNVQVYMGRKEIRAINAIKNYFGNHMDELED